MPALGQPFAQGGQAEGGHELFLGRRCGHLAPGDAHTETVRSCRPLFFFLRLRGTHPEAAKHASFFKLRSRAGIAALRARQETFQKGIHV